MLDPLLLHRLGILFDLPAHVRNNVEEMYLNEYAKSTMPNATAEELDRAKTEWRAEVRLEQLRTASREAEHCGPVGQSDAVTIPGAKLSEA